MNRVLVTGGSRGIGLEICRDLLGHGWHVIATARSPSRQTEQLRHDFGAKFQFLRADFARQTEVGRLIRQARILHGLRGFVANAGVGTEGMLTLMPESAIRESLEINLIANILLTRAVIKGMLRSGGSLVFISSIAAREGMSGLTVYGSAKSALAGFARAIAREYGPRGIRANCVTPGFVETRMTDGLDDQARVRVRRRTALRRLGTAAEVARCVSFLMSDAAGYVSGAELVVDGGFLASG